MRAGQPKLGLFLNSHSPTVAEQLAHSGYDWLPVDRQHGPMGNERLSAMLSAIANGGATSLVRVEGFHDRGGIQQSLDMGADGVLIPYINTAAEARQAVSCARYPDCGHAFGLLPAAQHEQRWPAWLRRQVEQEWDRRLTGGNCRLHQEY